MGVNDRELMLQAMRMIDEVFQREVLDKLARLETKMDTLVGNGQLGRVKTSERQDRGAGAKSEMRNSLHNRRGECGDQRGDRIGDRAA